MQVCLCLQVSACICLFLKVSACVCRCLSSIPSGNRMLIASLSLLAGAKYLQVHRPLQSLQRRDENTEWGHYERDENTEWGHYERDENTEWGHYERDENTEWIVRSLWERWEYRVRSLWERWEPPSLLSVGRPPPGMMEIQEQRPLSTFLRKSY